MDDIIRVKDLHHCYPNGCLALRGVSVSIERGDFVAIIGQNGSGKTTLAKHLNGLLRATSGTVHVKGQDVALRKVSEMALTVGYCFQNPDHQIFCETVGEEIAFGPRNLHLDKKEIDERVSEALDAVGLLTMRDQSPRQMSRGQRQRVAVASILSMHPEVLVIDEPTTGQDHRDSVDMLSLIRRLNEEGHTVLFITHNMSMVAKYARRVIAFQEGQILLDGSTREVFNQVDTLRSASLSLPQVILVAHALQDLIATPVLSVEDLVEATVAALGARERKAVQ